MTLTLHDFQTKVCRDVWRKLILEDQPSCLIQAACGSGKTVMGGFLLKQMMDHLHYDGVVFAHRREIVKQTAAKLGQANVWPGVLMAGDVLSPARPVQVASIDSYTSWVKGGRIKELRPRICWVDEAHRSMSPSYLKVISDMMASGTKLLGTTATPIRSDGKGLGELFKSMVCAPSIAELTKLGFLVPIEYYVGIVPDVSGVKLTAGDYDAHDLQQVLDQKMLIGDIVHNWLQFSRGRPTMCFASGVEHSMHIVEQFKARGIRAAHIDGTTNLKVRDDATRDLATGQLDIISNANVYVEGTDIPCVSCIIDCQPTKSVGRYMQKGGRGSRISPGKDNCHYHDHSGNVYHHGRIEKDRTWMLCNGKEQAEKFQSDRRQEIIERTCSVCRTLYYGASCPTCGNEYERQGKEVHYLQADLAKMTVEQHSKVQVDHSPLEKQYWWQEAKAYAGSIGKKSLWAEHCYKAKWGDFPPRDWLNMPQRKVTDSVEKYMRSQLIRYAKGVNAKRVKQLQQ